MTGPHGLPDLSHEETLRYSRHLTLPEVGAAGQRRLKAGRVVVIGAGGLGSPAALYLAAAGVGTIGVVDFDAVEQTNLQRQILHGTSAVGRPKLESAAERLADVNPHVEIRRHDVRLTSDNALEVLRDFDVVVDGSDNFPTRYLVNDACVLLGKPYVYGAIFRFDGQTSVFATPEGPCYRCLFRDPPPPGSVPSCAEAGVLGVLPGVIGSIQALEAIKLLLGQGRSLAGRLLLFDALKLEFRELALRRDPECPVCGERPTVRELVDYEAFCGVEPTPQAKALEVSVGEVARMRADDPALLLLDVRMPVEWDIGHIEGSRLIPLGELPDRLGELAGNREIVTVCRTGVRSLRAVELLRAAGFRHARSMRGGVHAWSEEVDPSMPRY
ncbi:MAG: molybdopterin-synthase adenylyltransferase MoeB [Gemmatimonadota bacterium]|nr:MAG: molybdopterin-synthase adenylyltransferase MoeB [Gemmatimonadota bacterium]